ncbi:hypothetical protein V6N12_029795 [Hibiscus sabdariffa]|uniref:Uncharacterized protein n=1 Tax=Hibiscus sabdariffa TaxID=183260 RepID=A0ABR2CX58_9ROSI
MSIRKDPSTPPTTIRKIGPYTVFITPSPAEPPVFQSPTKAPPPSPSPPTPPPVQPPPQQFDKSLLASESYSDGSFLGFLKNAAFKLQNELKRNGFILYLWKLKKQLNYVQNWII